MTPRYAARLFVAVCVLMLAARAGAQSGAGAIASGSVAAALDSSSTDVSLAGSLGYRFNRVIGLGVELTWMKLNATTPSSGTSPYTSLVYSGTKADTMFFMTNVRIEIPTTSSRILPFAIGGGGTANTMNRYTVSITPVPVPLVGIPPSVVIPAPIPRTMTVSSSSTGLALTLGGGVSLLATEHLSVDIDLRSLYIRDNPSRSIGRFGVGASYRF
jgi:opacity protein-like surface antigen